MATNHSICAQHQHGLTCKGKKHPIRPRLGEPNDIAAKQTRTNRLPYQKPGKPSVLLIFFHAGANWPNAKLTDDEERANDARIGIRGRSRSSSFGPASCSATGLSFLELSAGIGVGGALRRFHEVEGRQSPRIIMLQIQTAKTIPRPGNHGPPLRCIVETARHTITTNITMASNGSTLTNPARRFRKLDIEPYFIGCDFATNVRGQRPEPAATDVRFVPERNGWLRFAAPFGSTIIIRSILPYAVGCSLVTS